MARTGTQENKDANKQMADIQTATYNDNKNMIADYNKSIAAMPQNPYSDPAYLANENLTAATGAHAATANAKDQVDQAAERSGENTAARPYLTAMMNHDRAQGAATALEGQQAQDFQNNLAWKQWLAGAKLAPTGANTAMFGSATGGRDAALGNLTNIGNSTWNNITGVATGMMKGASAGVTG